MAYKNKSFESTYTSKNNVSLDSFFFFNFFSNRSRVKNIFRQFNSLDHPIKCLATLIAIIRVL